MFLLLFLLFFFFLVKVKALLRALCSANIHPAEGVSCHLQNRSSSIK